MYIKVMEKEILNEKGVLENYFYLNLTWYINIISQYVFFENTPEHELVRK
jgi:hypothetical protein